VALFRRAGWRNIRHTQEKQWICHPSKASVVPAGFISQNTYSFKCKFLVSPETQQKLLLKGTLTLHVDSPSPPALFCKPKPLEMTWTADLAAKQALLLLVTPSR